MDEKKNKTNPAKKITPHVEMTEDTVMTNTARKNKLKNRMPMIYIVALGLILALLYYYRGQIFVASVNNTLIPRTQLLAELEKQGGKQVLDSIVTETLIRQEAKKRSIVVSKDDIKKEIDKVEKRFTSQGQKLDDVLSMQGMSRADLEKQQELQIMLEKMVDQKKLTISDKEVQDYIKQNKASLPKDAKPAEVEANVKEVLKSEKLSKEIQSLVSSLRAKAKIQYWKTY